MKLELPCWYKMGCFDREFQKHTQTKYAIRLDIVRLNNKY
jgi:hypothetical protein